MKVGDLVRYLKRQDQELEVGIAATPRVTHWVQGIEGFCLDSEGRLVLVTTEETLDIEEPTLGKLETL